VILSSLPLLAIAQVPRQSRSAVDPVQRQGHPGCPHSLLTSHHEVSLVCSLCPQGPRNSWTCHLSRPLGQWRGYDKFLCIDICSVVKVANTVCLNASQCARLPLSNTPITDVTSNDIRCNAGTTAVPKKCIIPSGSTVTVEMHQQPGDRSCGSQAIGGAHWGPVAVYLSAVPDVAAADGSTPWFKIFQDSWAAKPGGGSSDDDYWGTKDLNSCCGRMDVPIPADIPSGDYLLRAEALALHTAGALKGAQFYVTCYQIAITGGNGTAKPETVLFPGAFKATDPGILVDIHSKLSTYIAPGPDVYSGGTTKTAGSACAGCESTCKVGSGSSGTVETVTLPSAPATSSGGRGTTGAGGCAVQQYGQCGGTGYTGCNVCGVSRNNLSKPLSILSRNVTDLLLVSNIVRVDLQSSVSTILLSVRLDTKIFKYFTQ